ncbi:porin [Sutterella sp.]|uniref:porin n=1 Tax=Sutterella sp. TaxID=1981025 RepID=UPI003FD89572
MTARMLPAALAATALFAAAGAQAADVQIYGRLDTGLVYQNYFGDSTAENSFTMASGANTATRVGIQGKERISEDLTVGFRLENRFLSDTGAFQIHSKGHEGRIFGGQSTLTLSGKSWGEVTFGRVAGQSSGSGPYDMQFYMDAFGGGTVGTGLSPAVKSVRYDNMLVYRTPMMAGLQATAQYSLKTDGYDEGDESTSDVNRYWSAGVRYNRGGLNLVAIYEGIAWGHEVQIDNGADKDLALFTLGGSYKWSDLQVYAQAQYFDGANAVDKFSAKTATKDRTGHVKGYGLYAGAQIWFGLSSWQNMVYWKDYTLEPAAGASTDGSTLGAATKFLYRPSKTVEIYVGGGVSAWDRIEGSGVKTDKTFNAFSGVTKYF